MHKCKLCVFFWMCPRKLLDQWAMAYRLAHCPAPFSCKVQACSQSPEFPTLDAHLNTMHAQAASGMVGCSCMWLADHGGPMGA
jgi:hypothetical protein